MIVEIIGLPSVGKSSIMQNLYCKDYNAQDKIRFIGGKGCKLSTKIVAALSFFIKLLFTYPKIVFNIDKSVWWMLTKISYRLCNYKNNIKQDLCVLNDAGVLMPIITFLVQRNKNSYVIDLHKIVAALPVPDLVVFIESNVDTVVKRYINRGGILRHGARDIVIDNSELCGKFLLGHNTLLKLKELLIKNKCIVITVDNNNENKYFNMTDIFIKELASHGST